MNVEGKLGDKMCKDFLLKKMGALGGPRPQHCCIQGNISSTGAGALLREQGAGAVPLLRDPRLHRWLCLLAA